MDTIRYSVHGKHLIRQQLIETPKKSDRQIADGLGVSPTTVGTARKTLEDSGQVSKLDTSTGQIDQLETRVGADGKERRRPVSLPFRTQKSRARVGLALEFMFDFCSIQEIYPMLFVGLVTLSAHSLWLSV